MSVIIYQEHCEFLEKENKKLKREISFLKTQLELKTYGRIKPFKSKDNESY
tara:strand:+ start:225 stop:377 length:153 start_codon:yes stop_codon:yes gene_type:complete